MNNEYKVISLKLTQQYESNFNYEYHKKYIGMVGKEKDHYYKSGAFKDFRLLVFEEDSQGRPIDADWIHKDDLKEIDSLK